MNHPLLDLRADLLRLGFDLEDSFDAPTPVIDLRDLAAEHEPKDRPPPSLMANTPLLWSTPSNVHSALLSTSARVDGTESWEVLVEHLAEESRHIVDEAVRDATLCEAGRLLIERLGRQQDGELLLRRSQSAVASTLLRSHKRDAESLAQELAQLEALGRETSQPAARRCAAWIEFGQLCEERTRTREQALQAYQQALEIDSDDHIALRCATNVARELGNRELARSYIRMQLDLTEVAAIRVSLLLDFTDLLENDDERISALEQALELDPDNEAVLRRMSRVLAGRGEAKKLGHVYRKLATIVEDPISASTAMHLAFLTFSESDEPVDQLARDLADRESKYADRTDVLAPLAEVALYVERRIAAGDDPLGLVTDITILERLAPCLDDFREQAFVREQLARLRMNLLKRELRGNTNGHVGILSSEQQEIAEQLTQDLRFALHYLPEHAWLRRALAEVFELRGDYAALANHLEAWARHRPAGPGRASLLLRAGKVYEDHFRDFVRAAEAYELAVAEDSENPNCLRAFGRINVRMRRWAQAVGILQRQAAETEDQHERLANLRQIARFAEHELGDVELAITALENIAKADPADILSLYQLAKLCRVHQRHEALAQALQQLAHRVTDKVAQTSILVELGEVYECHLKQRVLAKKCYADALALSPSYGPALLALGRFFRESAELENLLELLDPKTDTVSDPALLALRSGRVWFEELGNVTKAIESLRAAYNYNPDLVAARETLLQLLTASGRMSEAYDLLRAQDPPQSPALAADHHYRLGLLAEATARQLRKRATPRDPAAVEKLNDNAIQHYRATLEIQPDHSLAFERTRRILANHHDYDNLVRLYQQRLATATDEDRLLALVQLARLKTATSEDPSAARRAYEDALNTAPNDPIIRREFEDLLRLLGDRETLPALYLRTANSSEDPHLKAALLVEAAELLLSTGKRADREVAGRAILDALRVDPANPYAVRHLERLLNDPDTPLAVSEAVSARAVRAQSAAERSIFYLESAELLERFGSAPQALRAYNAASEALPGLLPAELGAKRINEGGARGQADEGTETTSLHVLMTRARDAAAAASQGNVAAGQLCIELLAEVLKYDHEHEAAIGLARTLANSADTAQAALQLLASTLEHLKANDKIYDLALFLAERSDSDREAIRCYRAACNAYPRGRRALRGLFERYRNVGDVERAEDVANRLFKLLEPGDPSALEIRFNLAQALAQTQETIPHAMAHARTVLEARPNDLHALRLNVDLLERIGRPVEAANLLDRWVARAAERSEQHAITLRKATLLEAAGELDRALEAAKHALALSPNHAVGVALTVSLLQKTGADEEVGAYLPSARAALVDRINRGEVIDEDFALLSIVAKANDRDLGTIAEILLQIILASDLAQLPEPHPATAAALDGLLETPALRASLYSAAEPQQLHQLLRTIDGPLGKLLGEFPALDPERATAAILNRGDMNPVRAYARAIAFVAGVENLKLEMAEPEHTAFLQGNPPLLRLGRNVWEQGDMLTWRGMIAVAAARLAMGSARTRTLPPGEFDLILAACFDAVGVFNPMAADPDPNRRRSLAMQLAGQWDQQTRDEVENLCKSMANYAFDPGRTTLALWSTDLRLACLLSGDLAGCLAAAAFVDGGAGSTLKKRIENSAMARELLAYLTSSEFVIARRALQ